MTTTADEIRTTSEGYGVQEARIDLAAAHRLAVLDNLHEGSWNHFSLTVPGAPDHLLLTPGDTHWSQVTASNLVMVGPDAEKVKALGNPILWSGYCIHYPIHMARPDAACVLHAHPLWATALSLIEDGKLLPAQANALGFYGKVAYTDTYDGFVTPETGAESARALGDNTVLFERGHGVAVVGLTVAEAYTDLYSLERACQTQILAMSTGRPIKVIPERDRPKPPPKGSGPPARSLLHFAAMKRVLDLEQPDYAT